MRSLFFIGRHGETVLNESGKYRGWSDGPDAQLNEDGIRSAHELGEFLAKLGQKFTRIICSPLNRATLTAAIVAGYLNIDSLTVDPRLRPLNVGSLAGKPKDKFPVGPYLKDKNKRFPDGENVNEFEARQKSFGEDLLLMCEGLEDDEDILVLAHVSNVMYWWNLQTAANDEEYLGEATDIVEPGGAAMVTDHTTLAIFKQNLSLNAPKDMKNFDLPPDHKPGMVVPKGGSSCASCKFVSDDKKHCSNIHFLKWHGNDVLPAPADEYCSDWYEEKK